MKSMRRFSTIFLMGACLGGFSACSSALMNTPVSKRADGWVVTLSQAKEGPDQYIGETVDLRPEKGEKFIWALVNVRSEHTDEQTFSYDTCTLGDKGQGMDPLVVARYPEVNSAADSSEAFVPGQERTRQLIYRYAKEQLPTRLKCGSIVLPIQWSSR